MGKLPAVNTQVPDRLRVRASTVPHLGSRALRPGRDAKPSGNRLPGSSFDTHCRCTKPTSFFFFSPSPACSSNSFLKFLSAAQLPITACLLAFLKGNTSALESRTPTAKCVTCCWLVWLVAGHGASLEGWLPQS